MTQTALILGASGRFSRHAAHALRRRGWTVRLFDRRTDDLATAAEGAELIVAGWNPAYQDWAAQVPDLHARIRKVALANDATVILPGNVYVFGEQTPAPWGEHTPHGATNPLGVIRRKMEQAYKDEGVRTIVLRSGDYLDTEASGNWFDIALTKKLTKGILTYPGVLDAPHAWAFLPDLTRAMAELADMRATLHRFEDIPYPGYTLTGAELAQGLARATGQPVRTKTMSWLPLQLLRPFNRGFKHLLEMRYLWSKPHWLDGTRLHDLLPGFQQTPLEEALQLATSHLDRPTYHSMSTQTN